MYFNLFESIIPEIVCIMHFSLNMNRIISSSSACHKRLRRYPSSSATETSISTRITSTFSEMLLFCAFS